MSVLSTVGLVVTVRFGTVVFRVVPDSASAEPSAAQPIAVLVELSIRHGGVAPLTVVVPGVIVVALPPDAVITPPEIVMVVPSGLTHPTCDVVAVVQEITLDVFVIVEPSVSTMPKVLAVPLATAGAPSLRIKVVADPLTAVAPAVAVGFAPVGAAVGVAQFAAVPLVAVNTCPLVGAVEPLTATVVVAELRPLAAVAVPAVRLAAVPVAFVALSTDGVPRLGVVSVGDVSVRPAMDVVVDPLAMLVEPMVIGNPDDPPHAAPESVIPPAVPENCGQCPFVGVPTR
jgi:hypothetical protein